MDESKLVFATDWIELATAVVAAIGLGLTVYSIRDASHRASRERKAALEQAQQDLKWRQTVEAQAAIRRLLDDKRAFEAMTMLDWDGQTFPVGETNAHITSSDIVDALKATGSFTAVQAFIRAGMDSLFNHLELIQQAIDARIFKLEDVVFPIEYYIRKMEQIDLDTFAKYMTKFDFAKSDRLISAILALQRAHAKRGA